MEARLPELIGEKKDNQEARVKWQESMNEVHICNLRLIFSNMKAVLLTVLLPHPFRKGLIPELLHLEGISLGLATSRPHIFGFRCNGTRKGMEEEMVRLNHGPFIVKIHHLFCISFIFFC